MLQPHNDAFRPRELGEDVRQVAGAGTDVQYPWSGAVGRGRDEGEEGAGGGGVHVRSGDCGAVADGLGVVGVGGSRGVVGAVDL